MLKAKTKRKIKHLVAKKSLVKRKHSKRLTRGLFIAVLTACAGSLAYASVSSHPVVEVGVHAVNPGGVVINAHGSPHAAGAPDQTGRGSWYALGLPAPDAITCASRTFPRGTYLQVKDLHSGRSVVCLVNDYGPEAWTGRVIDLSRGSFRQVDNLGVGTIPVEIRVVDAPPAGFKIKVPSATGLVGYALCHNRYTSLFCETHRQSTALK